MTEAECNWARNQVDLARAVGFTEQDITYIEKEKLLSIEGKIGPDVLGEDQKIAFVHLE
jgi:DNA-binding XRE family transcriptional regulator